MANLKDIPKIFKAIRRKRRAKKKTAENVISIAHTAASKNIDALRSGAPGGVNFPFSEPSFQKRFTKEEKDIKNQISK